jgi:hypothetical protein
MVSMRRIYRQGVAKAIAGAASGWRYNKRHSWTRCRLCISARPPHLTLYPGVGGCGAPVTTRRGTWLSCERRPVARGTGRRQGIIGIDRDPAAPSRRVDRRDQIGARWCARPRQPTVRCRRRSASSARRAAVPPDLNCGMTPSLDFVRRALATSFAQTVTLTEILPGRRWKR